MPNRLTLAFGLSLAALLPCRPAAAADRVFTDKDLSEITQKTEEFKRSHSVMTQQRERLNMILNAFLVGDTVTILAQSDELLSAVSEISRTYPPTPQNESVVWQIMAKIIEETRAMKEEALKNDYGKAYRRFVNVTANCIQCHQAVREWGKFPTPAPPVNIAAPPAGMKTESSQAPSKTNQKEEPVTKVSLES